MAGLPVGLHPQVLAQTAAAAHRREPERHPLGHHRHFVGAGHPARSHHQSQRIGTFGPQRTCLQSAAVRGGHPICGGARLAGGERRQLHGRSAAMADRLPQFQPGRVEPGAVGDLQVDAGRLADRHHWRAQDAPHFQTGERPVDNDDCGQQRARQRNTDDEELDQPEDAPGDDRDSRCCEHHPALSCGHQRPAATGTAASSSWTAISAVSPRAAASGRSMTRCASTGIATAFTSSGIA